MAENTTSALIFPPKPHIYSQHTLNFVSHKRVCLPVVSEPCTQLSDTHCPDLRPHVLVAVNKHAGEESLHRLLKLVLVPSEVPSL